MKGATATVTVDTAAAAAVYGPIRHLQSYLRRIRSQTVVLCSLLGSDSMRLLEMKTSVQQVSTATLQLRRHNCIREGRIVGAIFFLETLHRVQQQILNHSIAANTHTLDKVFHGSIECLTQSVNKND